MLITTILSIRTVPDPSDSIISIQGFPGGASDKEFACQCRRHEILSWVGKIPWRRTWQLTPVFLLGESHGQRSLVGYSPWGHQELNTEAQQS